MLMLLALPMFLACFLVPAWLICRSFEKEEKKLDGNEETEF